MTCQCRIRKLPILFDENVNNDEDNTSAEKGEENAFLDAVMDSAIMQEAYAFLSQTSKGSVYRVSQKFQGSYMSPT